MTGEARTGRDYLRTPHSDCNPVLKFLYLVVAALPVLGAPATSTAAQHEVSTSGFTSARVCGECHSDIYDSWKNSLHAFSLTDPIFDTAFMQAIKAAGDDARQVCLRCHAPMVMVNQDFELKEGVTREGVSCDFCHTVTAVHVDGRERPYDLDVGPVKRSVIRETSSPAHEVAYSELHMKSEFCGGCHNFINANGKAIMSTYDEWKSGPYAAEGRQCQDCHMVLTDGYVVREDVQESSSRFHLHNLIHDTDQLRSALTVQIANTVRSGNQLQVEVVIENVGSGHMVPTGMPSREVVLTVSVDNGRRVATKERRYRRVIADKKGKILKEDYEALLHGAQILNDNRIGPREVRTERFSFDLPISDRRANVSASLSYLYSPVILHRQQMDVQLGRVERVVY